MPCFTKKRLDLDLTADQKGLLIFDVFTGQMTSDVKEVIEKHNFIVVNVPGNMRKYYQVLDLTVNKYAKAFTSLINGMQTKSIVNWMLGYL